jgi:NAD(P)-dependent dehydrogenase (short-subunit alcohol dehydrogenase family)
VATQQPVEALEDLSNEQWLRTSDVNIHSYFRMTKAALPHLRSGSAIINTGSVNGLRGNKH